MKRTSMFALFFFFLLFGTTTGFAATQYVWDANTLVLDHFNGSTTASYVGGSPTYGNSVPGLNQAIAFTPGIFAIYALPSWNSASGGTVEAWVNPSAAGIQLPIFTMELYHLYTSSRLCWKFAYTPNRRT